MNLQEYNISCEEFYELNSMLYELMNLEITILFYF